MAPSDSLTLKTYTKIVILGALAQKLWSKTSFCIMVDNVTRSHMCKLFRMFIDLLKGPDPCLLVLKFGNILPINSSY